MRLLWWCCLLPLTLGSSLGPKGPKGELKGKGFSPGLPCHTEYDDVWEEKCTTVYEDKCTVHTSKQCHNVPDRQCTTKEEEQCDYVPTQKCSSIPIPRCGIVWEKQCSSHPSCKTHYDKQCTTVDEPECHTDYDEVCSEVVETICKEIAIGVEQGGKFKAKGVKGEKAKHEKGGKGLNEHIAVESLHPGLEHGNHEHGSHEHGSHEHGGHELASPGHTLLKRSDSDDSDSDDSSENEDLKVVEKRADRKKLNATEAYILHKVSLEELKLKIEIELAELEREEEGLGQSETEEKTSHVLQKRSRSAVVELNPKRRKARKLQKRSLMALKEQVVGELELLEEGDFTGEIEEINERRRRSLNSPEVQKVVKKIDGVMLKANEVLSKDVRAHKGKVVKRSIKGKGKGETLNVQKECWEEPRTKCSKVPREVCVKVPKEVCRDIPNEVCTQVEHCKDIPKKDCQIDYKEVCANIPIRQCRSQPREVCIDVSKEVCEDVPREVCVPFPGKQCQKVIVKRPREVCLPPQKVRVLDVHQTPEYSEGGHEENY